MASHSLVTVGNSTPVKITPAGTHSGMDITVQNVNPSGYIYVGGDSTLSATNYGYRLMPNHAISFELPPKDSLYVLGSSAELKVAVLRTGLEVAS
jgi:hypothetical protein